jgi:hypothetical protein
MNYLKIYCNLIRKAENRTPPEGYTEKHHTFPKSIFGKNNRIVVLTAREHYIAHALLEKIYIKRYGLKDCRTIKMNFAHVSMKAKENYTNSYLYENARKRMSVLISGSNHWFYNKNLSKEHKKKISDAMFGEGNPRYGKPGCIGEKNGMYASKRFGKLNPMYNKKQSEEAKRKISKNAKERYKNGYNNPRLGKKMNIEQILSMSKEFCVVSPDGEIVKETNQREFCRKNNLDQGGFNRMVNGKSKTCKGWTLYKSEDIEYDNCK